jgi:citronellol/citronellal dehydrogenase
LQKGVTTHPRDAGDLEVAGVVRLRAACAATNAHAVIKGRMPQINPNGVLAGQVAVITGASRGIGEALAYRYAMEGAKVVIAARTSEPDENALPGSIAQTAQRITRAGGQALAVRADLSVAEDRRNLISAAETAFGQVDILINNAAITYFIPVETFPHKRFELMMEVQVWAPFELAQLVLPGMKARGRGYILNISSHAALHPRVGMPGRGGTVYGMCKAALERFTTGLAQEVQKDGIAVNAISPGLVATPGVIHHKLINERNQDRVTPVEHMAEACLRLCHGDPKELTGRITYADQMIKEFGLQPADLI